jgi:hypothetical protein
MKAENRQQFEVQSYIGSEVAQLHEDGERPPRSAKLVVGLDMATIVFVLGKPRTCPIGYSE